jgi:hypothetical protein
MNDVERAPLGKRDHGFARRKRFDHHHSEVVDPRMQQRATARAQCVKARFTDARHESHVRSHEAFEACALGALADHDEPLGPSLEGAQRQIDALVRYERRNHEEGRIGRGPRGTCSRAFEAPRVDGRLDDDRVATVVPADAIAGIRAVCNHQVRPTRCGRVPAPQVLSGAAKERASDAPSRNACFIRRLILAHVAQRRVDVCDVEGGGRCDGADRDAVAARDDQRVPRKIERFDRQRKKRQKSSKMSVDERSARHAVNGRRGYGPL